jgi:hypothetical protein
MKLDDFTRKKGYTPIIHPFSIFPSLPFTLKIGDSPSRRGIHPTRRIIHSVCRANPLFEKPFSLQ